VSQDNFPIDGSWLATEVYIASHWPEQYLPLIVPTQSYTLPFHYTIFRRVIWSVRTGIKGANFNGNALQAKYLANQLAIG
jgi:hypothetical protein